MAALMQVAAQVTIDESRPLHGSGSVAELVRALVDQGTRRVVLRDPASRLLHLPPAMADATLLGLLESAGTAPVLFDASLTDAAAIERVSRLPLDGVVIGAAALFEPMLLRWSLDLLGPRTIVELRADGEYLFDPPANGFALELIDAARQLHFQGVRHVLLRDVTGTALPLPRLQAITDAGLDVTFQGFVCSVDDLHELAAMTTPRLRTVVLGEPLYDGRISIAAANAAVDVPSSQG